AHFGAWPRLLPVRRRTPHAARRSHRHALPACRPHDGEAGASRHRATQDGPRAGMKREREPRVVFGFHAVLARLRADPVSVLEIFLDESRQDARAKDLAAVAGRAGVTLMRVPTKRLDGFYGGGRHQGVVARIEVHSFKDSIDQLLESVQGPPLLLVLD